MQSRDANLDQVHNCAQTLTSAQRNSRGVPSLSVRLCPVLLKSGPASLLHASLFPIVKSSSEKEVDISIQSPTRYKRIARPKSSAPASPTSLRVHLSVALLSPLRFVSFFVLQTWGIEYITISATRPSHQTPSILVPQSCSPPPFLDSNPV